MLKLKVQGRYLLITLSLTIMALVASNYMYLRLDHQQTEELIVELKQTNGDAFDKKMRQQVRQITRYLAKALFDPLYNFNPDQVSYLLSPLVNDEDISKIIVFDSEGKIFHDGDPLLHAFGQKVQNAEMLKVVLNNNTHYEKRTDEQYIYAHPISIDNHIIGGFILEYSLIPFNREADVLSSIINDLKIKNRNSTVQKTLFIGLVILLTTIVIVILITNTITKPLKQLTRLTQSVAGGDYDSVEKLNISNQKDEIGELALSFQNMSRHLNKQNNKISFLAYHDALTKLPNRVSFVKYVDSWIDKAPQDSFAILFIDLDDFKSINDNYGHAVGDKLLQKIAERLHLVLFQFIYTTQNEVIDNDKMIARIGGDEFLVYLPGSWTRKLTSLLAKRLIRALNKPMTEHQDELVVGGSIGVAYYPEAGVSASNLIQHADIAMYHAKDSGKNTFHFFTHSMNEKVIRLSFLEKEMRKSLLNPEQFQLWFQPILELKSGKLIGAEALVRWIHPELGIISPEEFIPVAETTGMILPLGDKLIEQLCIRLQNWQGTLPDNFHVAINISAKQIYRNNLGKVIQKRLIKYHLDPSLIHIELTESMLMKDEEEAKLIISRFQCMGLKVWLDDFGTGYSSLSFLRKFELSGIKIDKSFVADITKSERDAELVKAIIALAKSLKMPVVAEGIETSQQLEFLTAHHCEYVQGYYFSKPLPSEQFESRYLAHTCDIS